MIGRSLTIVFSVLQAVCACAASGDVRKPVPSACLAPPIKATLRVSCGFHCAGYPFEKTLGPHVGADLAAIEGTPVYASEAGTVTWAGPDKDDTNIVAVRTKRGWVYRVLHLKLYAVRKGDKVFRGQFLGRSGGTVGKPGSGKYTTGAHLHFDLTVADRYVDPLPYICPTP